MELRRRHVILAVLAVFIAWGYATHWVPSIRWIPYAFVSGVVATVAISLWLILTTARRKRALQRPRTQKEDRIAFIAPQTWQLETAAQRRHLLYRRDPIYPPSSEVSQAADRLLNLILRDFVQSWYSKISPRPTFTNEVDRAIRTALKNILDRVLALDLVDIVVSRLIPIVTEHLRDFDEAERAVRGRKLSRSVTESEELDLAIAAKFREGKLHAAASLAYANPKTAQQQHLRGIVTRCLTLLLPEDMTKSASVVVLVKEIVSCAVLYPVTQALIDPDTWNKLLEGYGRAFLQERKTVRKLRAALDEHAPPSPKSGKPAVFPKLSANDSERRFERFIRAVRKCNNLSDARRFRSEVASQLWKESNEEGQDPLYLRRLETGKRMLDQKIASLGAGAFGKPKLSLQPPGQATPSSTLENAALREVLYNASGLSCFMEYMERLGLIRLVQFWIVVDGFRNPLEVDTDDPSEYVGGDAYWTESDRTDLAQINGGYLSKPELKVSPVAKEAVKSFLRAGKEATGAQYHAARRAVLEAQTAVYEEMQDVHFRNFKKTDLWFKLLASEEREAIPAPPSPTSSLGQVEEFRKHAAPKPRNARLSTTNALKPTDLRRAVVSATNLRDVARSENGDESPRRSLDDSNRAPLFDDEPSADPLADSVQSLDSDPGPAKNVQDPKVVDAMQTALNHILEEPPDPDSLFSDPAVRSPPDADSLRSSLDIPRAGSPALKKGKLSIASLGLVGGPASRGVFHDDLFGDEQKFIEDEREDSDDIKTPVEDEIHEAAPGDLGLAEAIDALTGDIEKLVTQEAIVDSLMKKAELTNNAAELRILRKSKTSLQREISRKELQRQQYIVQESESSLFGRATISITSIMVGQEPDGKEYALCKFPVFIFAVERELTYFRCDRSAAGSWRADASGCMGCRSAI
ncbi:PXA-domain-containing protein [Eremomyces bilateralis CBS 781.70]|uniref:PXA-domain-containing protein n=1 Tax=Eremomyces bilateralis CBS 781.70 TaxID=1392243 RepID=A0A6G1GG89_9PEZI|nr:PXA-domain-containing protein [Eremomyces bilateralis CBS 781.70]KAF1817117.1 PXA-domain-containing protein [Eremomyces bilateralis CBS 781.70]